MKNSQSPYYKKIILKAARSTVVLDSKIGNKHVTQSDFIDVKGNNYTVFSSTNEEGLFRNIKEGEIVKITFNENETKTYKYNPYTGKKMDSFILKAIDIQLSNKRHSHKTIDNLLSGKFPVKSFEALKKYPQNTTEEKIELLEDLAKTWKFFTEETKAGRLHYKPSTPDDTLGLVGSIELSDKVIPGVTSIQFNGRNLENIFTLSFKENEVSKHKLETILKNSLLPISTESSEKKIKSKGISM